MRRLRMLHLVLALSILTIAGCGPGEFLWRYRSQPSPPIALEPAPAISAPDDGAEELRQSIVADTFEERAAVPPEKEGDKKEIPSHSPPLLPREPEQPKAQTTVLQEKPVVLRPEPPTILQEAPGPKADNQLLGLWKKDIERAMQQPRGRRRIQFSLPVVQNERVRYFVDYFSGKRRNFFGQALGRSGKYVPMMAAILQDAGLPEDLVYLSLIESGFSPHAYSRAKAVGPWQFIAATGARYGLRIDWWVDERRDPFKSTRAAAAYLKDLHFQFGEWFLAAAAYNAGERKVEKAMNHSKTNDFWRLTRKNYLKAETRNYVPKFIAATLIAGDPDKHGFYEIAYEAPLEYDEVRIKMILKLDTIAELAQTTVETIRELNPALLRDHTPPTRRGFMLRLPPGSGEIFAKGYEDLPDSAELKITRHKVKKGETLTMIARRYRQRIGRLMEINSLKTQHVRAGQELVIRCF